MVAAEEAEGEIGFALGAPPFWRSLFSAPVRSWLRVVGVRAPSPISDLSGRSHDSHFDCPGKLDLVYTPLEKSCSDRREAEFSRNSCLTS
jgi:hypothetical protein